MLPLWSRAVAIVVSILALASGVVVLDHGSYIATLRIERHEPPLERTAHEASLLFGGPTYTVPASRIHATYVIADGSLLHTQSYEGSLRAMYQHAIREVKPGPSCQIVLRDPQPEPSGPGGAVDIKFVLRPMFGGGRDPGPPPSETLSFHNCVEPTQSELGQASARLDAWLVAGAHGTFEDRTGSRWRAVHWAVLVLLAFFALLAPIVLFRVDVEVGSKSVRVLQRLGPIHRVVAEVLASEIRAVRIATRELGPISLHRPTLSLTNNRVVELWPVGRMGMVRAFEARDALVRLIAECPRGEGGVPFRGEG